MSSREKENAVETCVDFTGGDDNDIDFATGRDEAAAAGDDDDEDDDDEIEEDAGVFVVDVDPSASLDISAFPLD
jgi:hypothetical protein